MTVLPKDLPQRLRKAGLKVIVIDGWESRTSAGGWPGVGVLNHHTGAKDIYGDFENDLAYARWMFLEGRPDLDPPLCNAALSLEGVVYLGARGNANHAGTAKASGSVANGDGNVLYWGIEWMLSGTQQIPKAMMKAGAILNAVLLDCMGSSVQAVSCHYQTSLTGKWDIGDPNGIPFMGHKVLDVPRFRQLVKAERKRLNAPPPAKETDLTLQLTPLQFSDPVRFRASDIEEIFSRDKDILGGTEAGAEDTRALLRAAATKHGYRLKIGGSTWVAVRKELIDSKFRSGYIQVLKANEGDHKHNDRGIPWISFYNNEMGQITVGSGHYLKKGRRPGDPNHELNLRYAYAIGAFARRYGNGPGLVFYMGDQNIVDRNNDTFFGQPLTSAWDEKQKWRNTGHGNIDVIASYDRDARVSCKSVRALNDKKLHLHGDHFVTEAKYTVRHLKGK